MAASNFDDIDDFGAGTAYDEPSRGLGALVKMAIGGVALVVVAAFGWVVWIAYDEGVRTGAVKTVPVIKAETEAIRRKPDNPGGMVVPHQDKLVFNRLAPGQENEPVERLLPAPEAPVPLPVTQPAEAPPAEKSLDGPPAEPETQIATALTPKLVEPAPEPAAPAEPVAEVPSPPPPPAPPPEPTELAAKPPAPPAAAPAVPSTPPTPVAKEPAAPAPGPAWRIQLVSLSDAAAAEAAWSRMQNANKDLLGELKLQVQTVKLSKGTFYRVQAGPLTSRDAAASLCGSLKTRKQDCLVVAP